MGTVIRLYGDCVDGVGVVGDHGVRSFIHLLVLSDVDGVLLSAGFNSFNRISSGIYRALEITI